MPRKFTKGASPARSPDTSDAIRPEACEAALIAAGLVGYESTSDGTRRRFYGDIARFFGDTVPPIILTELPWSDLVHPEDLSIPDSAPGKPGEAYQLVYRLLLPDGRVLPVQDCGTLAVDPDTGTLRRTGVLSDASRLQTLEERLRYVHRMEAFGQLTGGVAHDFNNLLTLLRGYAELLQGDVVEDATRSEYVRELIRAADRAVDVTRQLQAFCRVQSPAPGIVNPGNCVMELGRMLRRMVGEEIEFVIDVAENSGSVLSAPSQIDAMVMQLVAHAREGLSPGSRLGLSVFDTTVRSNDRRVRSEGWIAGPYLVISVETRPPRKENAPASQAPRSKPPTFDALAEVRELWSASGGQLEMRSSPGERHRISAYLPRIRPLPSPVADAGPTVPAPSADDPPQGKGETILLVEDDPETLRLYSMGIERLGYTVLTAAHGEEAIRLAKAHPEIDLVLTDLVMPLMGGVELAGELKNVLPSAATILMSGYAPEDTGGEPGQHKGYPFLSKPFSLKTLAHKLREFIENH